MKNLSLLILLILVVLYGCAQNSTKKKTDFANDIQIGDRCEGCEAVDESPVPVEKLSNTLRLPDWEDKGSKLAIRGVVYKADGKTPAPDVVLYVYHTDQTGIYPKKGNEKGYDKQHGYIRGWIKTNDKGEYKFFTLRPGSYPQSNNPAHIHVFVKEPGKSPYWVDDYLFDDDPFLTNKQRGQLQERGGNGILKTTAGSEGKAQEAIERNIYLGKNIPNYK